MNESRKYTKGFSVDTINIYMDTENKTKILGMNDLEREMLKVNSID